MRTILKLTGASIKAFVRNRQALFSTLIMPLFIMLIFGYIGFDKPPKFDVGLVTHAPDARTAALVDQLKSFPTFTIHEGALESERAQLEQGNRSIVLDVPDNIAKDRTIAAYTNPGQASQAQTVLSILDQFASTAGLAAAHASPAFVVKETAVSAHNTRYIEFLLPGLLALSIMQMSVFSVAFVFTQYKEKGVLKRLLATPMQPLQFVAANAITRLIVSVVQAAIFVILGLVLFKIHIAGSYFLLAFCVILGALMFLGLGFTISGFAKTTDAVPMIANLVVFPMMFLGGTFFAVSNMPAWLQAIAKFLPLTFFSGALRDIMTKGASIGDIRWDILGMLIWGAILIYLATVTFRFQERESA
ncbi:MAG: ABC transporter permease [Candidatus Kaiserbacteria bacterium]|nr:ABC transporter permease [Candidatus Kaiserbacteria bacterium]